MNNFVNKLIRNYLGAFMDRSRDKIALSDKIYQKDNSLELDKKERIIINDYIACLMTREHRMADISYMAGVGDTVKFLNGIGLLKGSNNKVVKKRLKKL